MPPNLFTAAPHSLPPLTHAARVACLRLVRSEGIGSATFHDLIAHTGSPEAALAALPELARRGGRARPIRICTAAQAEAELEAADRIGASPVFSLEPAYPAALAAVEAPPPLVYVKGDAALLARPALAVVGSRQCSAAGHKLAGQLARALGEAGLVIVSGLARGIDAAAHEAALATGTIAVVAGGLDNIYPPEHADLQRRIGERGCVISEMPPGFTPRAQDFPRRNRIVSGLSRGVLVIEAARRSGTLVTARLAGEQGREVFAVPGHPLDPRAEGTNQLLKSGATLVTTADDVLEALRPSLAGGNAHGIADGAGASWRPLRAGSGDGVGRGAGVRRACFGDGDNYDDDGEIGQGPPDAAGASGEHPDDTSADRSDDIPPNRHGDVPRNHRSGVAINHAGAIAADPSRDAALKHHADIATSRHSAEAASPAPRGGGFENRSGAPGDISGRAAAPDAASPRGNLIASRGDAASPRGPRAPDSKVRNSGALEVFTASAHASLEALPHAPPDTIVTAHSDRAAGQSSTPGHRRAPLEVSGAALGAPLNNSRRALTNSLEAAGTGDDEARSNPSDEAPRPTREASGAALKALHDNTPTDSAGQDIRDAERARVLAALGPAPADVDTVARATGLPVQSVHVALLELGLGGRITRYPGGLVALATDPE